MPMSVSRYLAMCLSIPLLSNMNAGVAIASKLKGTQQEKEDFTGISVDGKTIVRMLKATFEPAKKDQLARYAYGVPKAPSSDMGELSNTEISLNDTLTRNELARARRRGIKPIINTEDGNEALSNAMEEEFCNILSSSVDSFTSTLSTLDSDSLSGSEPAKKKATEDPSSKPRRVYMHGGHNDGKTAKPWDKEAKRQRKSSVSNLYFESYCSYTQTQ